MEYTAINLPFNTISLNRNRTMINFDSQSRRLLSSSLNPLWIRYLKNSSTSHFATCAVIHQHYTEKMFKLKTLNRNYRIFVIIGVCAAPTYTSSFKKCGYICLATFICISYIITIIASSLFVLQCEPIDFGRRMNASYPAITVFGTFCTMVITFCYRKNLQKTFLQLHQLFETSK